MLAAAYGSDFPIGENPTFRRLGDREVSESAKTLESASKQLKSALDSDLKKDPSVDKASREGIVDEADQLSKDAKALRERMNDGSAEADQVIARAASLQTFIKGHQAPAAASAWNGVAAQIEIVATAYRIPLPSRTP